AQSQKNDRSMTAASAAIDKERTVAAFIPPAPSTAVVRSAPTTTQIARPAATMQPSTLGMGIGSSPSPVSVARESATMQSLKNNITAEVSHDDLDVPAFIRKRGDV